jgi:hypothetical protein
MPTKLNQMSRNRIKTRVRVGELGTLIQQRQDEAKQKFGKLMEFIMRENECSWEQAKVIYKRTKIENLIARELQTL